MNDPGTSSLSTSYMQCSRATSGVWTEAMRIQNVHIMNFRSLENVSIPFQNVTTFIGPNGTGKSTVLRALEWFFNGSKNGDLTEQDCTFENKGAEIRVEVTFSDLSQLDRQALGKYAPPGSQSFTAWKIRSVEGDEYLSANAKGFGPFTEIKVVKSATEKKELYKSLRDSQPSLDLPSATSGQAVDDAIALWESQNTKLLTDLPEALQTNFFGFNSSGKMSGIFDYVFVTADLRAGEESLDSRNSIIARILERLVDRSVADSEISKIVTQSMDAQRRVIEEKFSSQLTTISNKLDAAVGQFSPGRNVRLIPAALELKPPRTTFEVSIMDGENATPVERQGHGFQRTLLISSLQLLAESGSAGANGVICLAIEEPELFQHPIQAMTFAKVLRALADEPSNRIQVAYATHSPYFVEANGFHQIRRMTRPEADKSRVEIHGATLDQVVANLSGTVDESAVRRQLDATLSDRLPVALFAKIAVIVEGTTEASVLYGVSDRTRMGELESLGIAVVEVGGKGNIPLAHAILEALGIPTYVLFDGDKGFESRLNLKESTPEKIGEIRNQHAARNRNLMAYFGLEPEDFPETTETSKITILEDHLEGLLDLEWPEWEAAFKALESSAGISLKKNSNAYRKATFEALGSPCGVLLGVLEKSKLLGG